MIQVFVPALPQSRQFGKTGPFFYPKSTDVYHASRKSWMCADLPWSTGPRERSSVAREGATSGCLVTTCIVHASAVHVSDKPMVIQSRIRYDFAMVKICPGYDNKNKISSLSVSHKRRIKLKSLRHCCAQTCPHWLRPKEALHLCAFHIKWRLRRGSSSSTADMTPMRHGSVRSPSLGLTGISKIILKMERCVCCTVQIRQLWSGEEPGHI